MVRVKKKKVELQGEFTEKGIIAFPRFYIKAVGGAFSLEHRLTHTFMTSYGTEEELREGLAEFNQMDEYELYKWLIMNRHAHIPNNKVSTTKFEDSAEDWYLGAWGVYTTRFYHEHPHLFQEVKDIPRDIVHQVRTEKIVASTPKKVEPEMMQEKPGDVPAEKPAVKPLKPLKRPRKESPANESLPIIKEAGKPERKGKTVKRKVVKTKTGIVMPEVGIDLF